MASEGFDGAPAILGAPVGGLLAAYAGGGDASLVVDELGSRWDLAGISLRRWPAASSLQAVIGGLLAGPAAGVAADDVTSIEIGLPEGSYRLNGEGGWADQLGALQSARYVAAVVIYDGECWLDQFGADRLSDPRIGAFARDRVAVHVDDSVPAAGAALRIRRRDGTAIDVRIAAPPGDPLDPLTDDDVVDKLRRAAAGVGLADAVAGIAERVLDLERQASVADLTACLVAPSMPADRGPG
jgi:2-methylcitrate dehydratase PrpD